VRTAEKQPEFIKLNQGMDQSGGTRGGAPGTLYRVDNCRVRSGGLQKRCGSAAIASTSSGFVSERTLGDTTSFSRPTEKASLIGRLGAQKIAAATSGWVFAYQGTLWRYLGSVSGAQPVRKRLGIAPSDPTNAVGPYAPACAVNSAGYICTAAGFGSELRITLESPDGQVLYTSTTTLGAAAVVVRVVAGSATRFYVLAQPTDGTDVTRITVFISSSQAVSASGFATLITLANASSTWDASSYDGTTWFLVYQSGATTVTVAEYSTADTPVAGSSATFATTNNLTYLSVWADSVTDRVWVGVVDDPASTPSAQYRVYTDAVVLSVGPTVIQTGSSSTPISVPLFGPLYVRTPVAGDAFGVYSQLAVNPDRWSTTGLAIQAGSLTRETVQAGSMAPISKPDAQQRVWCMTHGAGANFQIAKAVLLRFVGTEFIGEHVSDPTAVVELASPDMVSMGATYHPTAAPGLSFHAVGVTSEAAGGKTYFALPFVLNTRTNASSATEPLTRVDVYEYTRYNQEPHRQVVPLGRSGVATGQPTELWGELATNSGGIQTHGGVELGYTQAPVLQAATTTPSGSGLAAGTYVYQAVRQWVDDEGNRHLSAPSAEYTLTLAVQSSVAIRVPNALVGQRSNIYDPAGFRYPDILLYRTQNGGTDAQQVPILGVDNTTYMAFTDTVADSIIDDNEFIYTAGGVLPNVLAPSCRYIAVSEERLWCGGLWDSNIIECSKIRVPGEPFNFTGHASHQVVIPGEVSGLAYMDGQVCVFTEDAIYLVSGDGPNDQGAGGFAPPRALVRGVGCPRDQSASILETEIGILFRSKMGFYVIPRGFGSPQYIGDKVQDEDTVVLSAATTTTSEHRLARFLVCAEGETKSDTVLTLDLTTGHWFRDTYQVNGSITGQGFSEIGEWPDGLALMSYGLDRTDNLSIIWAESESLTGDAGAAGAGATTYIAQSIVTNWVQVAGELGLFRCSEVVVKCEPVGSSSALSMTVETDANSDQTGGPWTITTAVEVAYRSVTVSEPQCTELRVTVSDAAGAANSAGVRFLALGLQTMPLQGIRRTTDDEGD